MTQRMRGGLGTLCIAGILVIVGLGFSTGTDGEGTFGPAAMGIGGFVAILGLVMIAVELFRDQTKSSSGERSSGDT